MLPPNEYADQIFDVLRFSIDLACTEQHWSTVSRDALAFGCTQRDVSTAFAYAQRFDLFIAPATFISLNYRSFDPSGPFRTLPAVSKFELTMSVEGEIVRAHQNDFDEPVVAKDTSIWGELSFT